MWFPDECVDLLASAIQEQERRLRDEQAVYGLDAMDEVVMHPLLARGLGAGGWGTLREQAYPTTWKKRTWRAGGGEDLPLPRERERCDLVLTERAGLIIADEVAVRKRDRKIRAEAQGTLFDRSPEGVPDPEPAEIVLNNADGVHARDAMWIEVKVLGQFEYADGVPSPNPSYASRLVRSVLTDVSKLESDAVIEHAASLIVLFTADQATAEHDLLMVAHKCLDRELSITTPVRRSVPIMDRIGNAVCTVAMFPVKR